MALTRGDIGVITLVVAMLCTGAAAQSNCTNAIVSLSPCLAYITGNSSSTPSSSCCTQLATVARSQPKCLCEVLNDGGKSLGLTINQTHALTLPSACKVQIPPISSCNAAASPANSPAGTPGSQTVPSGSGSNTIPTAGTDGSDGSSTKLPFSLIFFLLFIASYASTFTSF